MNRCTHTSKMKCTAKIIFSVISLLMFVAGTARAADDEYYFSGGGNGAGVYPQITLSGNDSSSEQSFIAVNNTSVPVVYQYDWSYTTFDTTQSPVYDPASVYTLDAIGLGVSFIQLVDGNSPSTTSGSGQVTVPPFGQAIWVSLSNQARGASSLSIYIKSRTREIVATTVSASNQIAVGELVSFTPVSAVGGDGALTFSITPALPTGLEFSSSTGVISGSPVNPDVEREYSILVGDGGQSVLRKINLTITSNVTVRVNPSIIGAGSAEGFVSSTQGVTASSFTPVIGSGGLAPLSYSVEPALPAGLSMSSSTGEVSGTATVVSSSKKYTVSVSDGQTTALADFYYSVVAAQGAPASSPAAITWKAGVSSSQKITVQSVANRGIDTVFFRGLVAVGDPRKHAAGEGSSQPDALAPMTFSSTFADNFTLFWENPVAGEYQIEWSIYDLDGGTTRGTISLTVEGEVQDQTLQFTSVAPTAVVGGTYTPTAEATSMLPVTFTIDPLTASVCSATNGVVNFNTAGRCLINANQPGNGSWTAAPQVQQIFDVALGQGGSTPQEITLTSASQSATVGGVKYTPTATSTSGLAVTFAADGATDDVCWMFGDELLFFKAGTCVLKATQSGSAVYAAAPMKQLVIDVAGQVVAVQAIADTALSLGEVADAFTPVTMTGGAGPYKFSVLPELPSGLTISTTTGQISGTPTTAAPASDYVVTVEDINGSMDNAMFSLSVTDGPTVDVLIADPQLTVGQATAVFLPVEGAGGTGMLSYAISPELPTGLSFNTMNGEITGTPSLASGSTAFTVTVTDEAQEASTGLFSLTVNGVVLTTLAVPSAYVTEGSEVIAFAPVTGSGGTPALSYGVAPSLPAGLTMSATTGIVSGKATEPSATSSYEVTVTDANGATGTQGFSFTVSPALVASQDVVTKTLTAGKAISPFTPVTASGGRTGYNFSVTPALPVGLVLSATTGEISGAATVPDSSQAYVVTVSDANMASAEASFSLAVSDSVVATQATPTLTLSANVTVSPFTPVTGEGGTGALTYSISPSLPDGLSMSQNTGEITGTVTVESLLAEYIVTVTDENSAADTAQFSLAVNGPIAASVAVASTQLSINTVALSYTPIISSGGTGEITFSVLPALPAGLTMSASTGEISGTPTVTSASTTYTVTITDVNNTTDTASFALSVSTISTSVSLASSNTAPKPGDVVVFTATIVPSAADGTITFRDGGVPIGEPVLLNSGIATLSTASLSVGTHSITAEYSGSATYDISISAPVAVSLQTPETEFLSKEDVVSGILVKSAVSAMENHAMNNADAVRAATGRLIESQRPDSDTLSFSSKSQPVGFSGSFDAADGAILGASKYLAMSSKSETGWVRLAFGNLMVSRDQTGSTTGYANGRLAWEKLQGDGLVGFWFGGDVSQAEISDSLSGAQSSVGVSTGTYFARSLAEDIYVNGFASFGFGWHDLELSDDVLSLNSSYETSTQMVGGSLSAAVRYSSFEVRPELGFVHGRTNIGSVGFDATAFGITDTSITSDMGSVSFTTLSATPSVLFTSVDQLTQYEVSPKLLCRKVKSSAIESDCGFGISLGLDRFVSGKMLTLSGRMELEKVGENTRKGLSFNLRRDF